jgi:multimeric flavodoxin WrbA
MKKILAFRGSPRRKGNSSIMLEYFVQSAKENNAQVEIIDPYKIDIDYCQGCLMCNVKHKCINEKDDWQELSKKILEADIIVFATPVYFHHLTAALKKILDRFRSFVHIKMTETGLIHTPYAEWEKKFVLLLSMGTVEDVDAQPILDLFDFIIKFLGNKSKLYYIKGKRLALAKQIVKNKDYLEILYPKLELPKELAQRDYENNQKILEQCKQLAKELCG